VIGQGKRNHQEQAAGVRDRGKNERVGAARGIST
jgi:hypothetical protein